MVETENGLEKKLFRYEMDFFSAEFCKVPNNLESRLSEHFYEIGSSGKRINVIGLCIIIREPIAID